MKNALVGFLCTLLFIYAYGQVTITNTVNAPDMPGFTPDLELIPAGSLIIPMDPSLQTLDPGTGLMSVLPYGLVIRTLHDNISIWWAIQTGKAFNGADVVAPTKYTTFSTIMGTANPQVTDASLYGGTITTTYSGGPFVILAKDAQNAFNRWYTWSQNPGTYYPTVDPSVYNTVAIHYLTQDTTMDIRHKIYVRPTVGVSNLDGNAATQTAMMGCIYQDNPRQCPLENGYGWGGIFGNGAAGCLAFQPQDHAGLDWGVHYNTYDCGSSVAALTATTCLTTFSEPHWEWVQATGPSYIAAMKSFIYSGANFIGQCASIQSYENQAGNIGTGTFMTQFGIGSVDPSNGIDPPTTQTVYPDLPVSQFIGDMSSSITGAVPDFYNYFSYPDAVPGSWNPPATEPGPAGEVSWIPNMAFPIVTNIINSNQQGFNGRNLYIAAAAKYNNLQLGANVWYLGGHTWAGQSVAGTENGRRFFFNAIIVPAARPAACGFTFCSASDTCPPQDVCHTCACNAAGNGFVQTPIAGCCLNNAACTGICQVCSNTTHTCVTNPTCCNPSAGFNCSSSCQSCTNSVCTSISGCCSSNAQCGSSPCIQCQGIGTGNAACVTLPTAQCCNSAVAGSCSSLGACQVCVANNTCIKNTTGGCCTVASDCGSTPCDQCNTVSNTCYKTPGCCAVNTDCGTNPCIVCVNNTCNTNPACCTKSSQCGACKICNSTNQCAATTSTSCCTVDSDCGSCRRCATSSNGTKSCVPITACCLTSADCELCENCTANQCSPISGCCAFDSDCLGCEICSNFTCEAHPTLYCCTDDTDCQTVAAEQGNATCPYYCTTSGVCQASCSSGINYTGLIVGLAAGVPLLFLAILGILAALALLLYMKKDYLNEKIFQKTPMAELGVHDNPAHVPGITVGHSAL